MLDLVKTPYELAELNVPSHFPKVPFPSDNELTEARWKLGKKLFFDPILSRDSSISCGSCHLPDYAFSDTLSFSLGVEKRKGVRNAPSLSNIAYHPYFNRDGGTPTLEMQLLVPIQEHLEFDFNIVDIADRMLRDSAYHQMSADAYNRIPDPYVISRAIATFERTLISSTSKYDRVMQEQEEFSEKEKKGFELFMGDRANCSSCHSGFNFTNYSFENNGLQLQYADSGRMRVTKEESDRAKFKVPSLRNIALTGPYMHDGSIESLKEVVEHYSLGVKPNIALSPQVRNIQLSEEEKEYLIAFLNTLSDFNFIENQIYKSE